MQTSTDASPSLSPDLTMLKADIAERMRRREIRASLTEWCAFAGHHAAAHHRLIIEKLEAVTRGEIRKLALFLPPGAAKSTYASILFPPWFMLHRPGASMGTCSWFSG